MNMNEIRTGWVGGMGRWTGGKFFPSNWNSSE